MLVIFNVSNCDITLLQKRFRGQIHLIYLLFFDRFVGSLNHLGTRLVISRSLELFPLVFFIWDQLRMGIFYNITPIFSTTDPWYLNLSTAVNCWYWPHFSSDPEKPSNTFDYSGPWKTYVCQRRYLSARQRARPYSSCVFLHEAIHPIFHTFRTRHPFIVDLWNLVVQIYIRTS